MKNKFIEPWSKRRSKGMHHYAFFFGVLGLGIPMMFMMLFVIPMLELRAGDVSFGYLVAIILVAFACGFLIGYCMSLVLSKQYWKALAWVFPLSGALYFLEHELEFVMPPDGKIIIFLIVYSIGGYLLGIFNWHSSENNYQKELRTRESMPYK